MKGHELCTSSSWVFPVLLNPFSINPQQAHPRPPGQQAMARAVQAHLAGERSSGLMTSYA